MSIRHFRRFRQNPLFSEGHKSPVSGKKRHINTNFLFRFLLGRPRECPGDKPNLSLGQTHFVPRTNPGFLECPFVMFAVFVRTPCFLDDCQIAHLICVSLKHLLYDFLGGVLRLLLFSFVKGPKHPLNKSYSKCFRRTQIR